MDDLDDLGVVDALQVDRRDAEVARPAPQEQRLGETLGFP
jgi:hypothetical protein